MNWNEKIDLIKKNYPDSEFSVPHINRKQILRNIESKFIKRQSDYYHPNNLNERFTNWYDNIDVEETTIAKEEIGKLVSRQILPNQKIWLGCEFTNEILVYKSSCKPTIELLTIGLTWANTYHLIGSKYEYIVAIRIYNEKIRVKKMESK